MNWGATLFLGLCAIVAVCTIVGTVVDAVDKWLRQRRIRHELEGRWWRE